MYGISQRYGKNCTATAKGISYAKVEGRGRFLTIVRINCWGIVGGLLVLSVKAVVLLTIVRAAC